MSTLAGALGEADPSRSVDSKEGINSGYGQSVTEDIEMDDIQENDENKDGSEAMDDLFGNDEEEETRDSVLGSPSASGAESERLPSPERERRQALEYEEEEIPPDLAMEVKEATVSFPNVPLPKSSDGNTWVIRMPNYVRVDSKPFHPDTYVGPEQEDEDIPQAENIREKSMTIKLQVENTVRWRWTKDEAGLDRRQSNGRIIRWSDGTLSLKLGRELFDINQTVDTSAGIPRQFVGSQASQPTASQAEGASKSQGLTYLVAQHKRSQVLQAEAVITGQMTLRPTGMQSETHRMLVRAVGQKHTKVAKLRMAPDPTTDPEREKMELIKQSAKQSKKKREPGDPVARRRKKSWSTRPRNMWTDDEEEDDAGVFDASDEGEDGIRYASHGRKRADKEPSGYQEDDFLVADESEGEEEISSRKKRKTAAAEGTEDELDRLDAKIEEDARRDSGGARESDGKEGEMDVESEEESDEELQIRRVKGAGRRKAPVFDDDDDE